MRDCPYAPSVACPPSPSACRTRVRRAGLAALAALALAPTAALGADPVLPLSEVTPGMRCTGLTVVRGTQISSFDVEILDVIAPEAALGGSPRLLVRASGAAIEPGGVGQGFSGSPILCGGRNAGAISETVGEYGNRVVLATPIEEILADRPARASGMRRAPRLARAARPLTAPLSVSGLSPATRGLLTRAARRAGRAVIAVPAGPAAGYPPVELRPGAAVAAAISTGDLALGAVGTVAYRDGERLWAFGHELEASGERALFLSDAYVFGVISNPLGLAGAGAITYKLASSAGHVQGAFTNDSFSSIAGRVGAGPPSIPLRVSARGPGGRSIVLRSLLADERRLGLGAGLPLVASLATGQAVERLVRSYSPVTLSMCARFRVRELRRPIGFCNPYFSVEGAIGDVGQAAALVDSFDLAPLRIDAADVRLEVRRGSASDVLLRARGPRRARPGQRIRVALTVQRRRGARRTLTVPVRVPASIKPGRRTLVLRGNGTGSESEGDLLELLFGALIGSDSEEGDTEPHSRRELAEAVGALRRPLGVLARFRGQEPRIALRSDRVSFEGRVEVGLRVVRRR